MKQANIFIQNKAIPISVGCGNKNKIFIEFLEDKNFINLMQRWLNKEF
jgi:hypothetical protein